MPIIPLLRPSPTTPTAGPRMALDNERRPTIDTRGIAGAVGGVADAAGQLARSSQMPDLPDELANGYRALGAVGSAIADAGSVIGALAIKRREAESIAQVAEAEAQVDIEEASFQKWKIEHPDPSKWEGEWANRLGKIQAIASNENLNEGARRRLEPSLKAYAGKSSIRVATDASLKTFERARNALVASASRAMGNSEFDLADSIIDQGFKDGYLDEDKAQNYRNLVKGGRQDQVKIRAQNLLMENKVAEAKSAYDDPKLFNEEQRKNAKLTIDETVVKKDQFEDAEVLAKTNPAEFKSKIKDPSNWPLLEPIQKVDLEKVAEQTREGLGKLEVDQAMDSIYRLPADKLMGKTIDELGVPFRDASPEQKRIVANQLALKQRKIIQDDPVIFEKALIGAMTYDPAKDPLGLVAVNMAEEFEQLFTGPKLERLQKELTKKQKPQDDVPTAATDIGPALALIDMEIDAGGLYPTERPVMVDGKQLYRDPKKLGTVEVPGTFWGTKKKEVEENDGKPVAVMEPDLKGEADNAAARKYIREKLEAEVKAGILKDQKAIEARAYALYKDQGGKMTPQPQTGPDANGMPRGGGVPLPSNPLLPSVEETIKFLKSPKK